MDRVTELQLQRCLGAKTKYYKLMSFLFWSVNKYLIPSLPHLGLLSPQAQWDWIATTLPCFIWVKYASASEGRRLELLMGSWVDELSKTENHLATCCETFSSWIPSEKSNQPNLTPNTLKVKCEVIPQDPKWNIFVSQVMSLNFFFFFLKHKKVFLFRKFGKVIKVRSWRATTPEVWRHFKENNSRAQYGKCTKLLWNGFRNDVSKSTEGIRVFEEFEEGRRGCWQDVC